MVLVKLTDRDPDIICWGSFFVKAKNILPSNIILFLMKSRSDFTAEEIDRIVEMAWEDRTPFDAIEMQFGVPEKEVIKIMRNEMKPSSFRMWRERVQGRKTKHSELQQSKTFKSNQQRAITGNKISKR